MHAAPKTHYKGYTIVANPVETIRRRFMGIFTIYKSEHASQSFLFSQPVNATLMQVILGNGALG